MGVARIEAPGLEDRGHEWKCACGKRERGGEAQQQRQFSSLALYARGLVHLADVDVVADLGKDRGADCRTDHSQRELIETVGIIEPADRAGANPSEEERVD